MQLCRQVLHYSLTEKPNEKKNSLYTCSSVYPSVCDHVCVSVHASVWVRRNVSLHCPLHSYFLHEQLRPQWRMLSNLCTVKLKNTKEEHFYFTELCTSRHHREGHKQYLEQCHTSCIWTSNTWLDTLCSLITSSENVTCGWIIASQPNVNKLFSHSPLTNNKINLRFSRTTQWNRIRISAEEGCII